MLFRSIGTYGGDAWNWLTNEKNVMGAPYINPSAAPICGIKGFGLNVSNTDIDCEAFDSTSELLSYMMRIVTWVTTRTSSPNFIQKVLMGVFPWTGNQDGPTSHELTCFVYNIGTLITFFLFLVLAMGVAYVFYSIYASIKMHRRIETIEHHINELGAALSNTGGKKRE